MADWRQIQARIRRAKTGADAVDKLTRLFDRTRDAMVAFELALHLEGAGQADAAVHWYTTAAQRFRRADWKKKAEDALVRLGAPVPVGPPEPEPPVQREQRAKTEDAAPEPEAEREAEAQASAPEAGAQPAGEKKRRRRGRRGGRRHRKGGGVPKLRDEAAPRVAAPAAPAPVRHAEPFPEMETEPEPEPEPAPRPAARVREPFDSAQGKPEAEARPTWQPGPALASRMAQLEMQLRRLIASEAHSLDEAEHAPASPGVFLLSDSDQMTHYYVEACQTLRIALGNLVKGRSGGRYGGFNLRPALAEHLQISEAKVKDYLRKHCIVRWVQLDEGASHLAHFVIAALKPVLNE